MYERDADKTEEHGPERFSLIYIGSEGVATYQALYHSHGIVLAALCIIQPGTGFRWNWTDFLAPDEPLHQMVEDHPSGKPSIFYYGGYGQGYDDFAWPGDEPTGRRVRPYYPEFREEVTIWKLLHWKINKNKRSEVMSD